MSTNREKEDSEGEEEEASSPAKKKKRYWKEKGYDELSKMYRVFTQYEKSLFAFVGEFSEFAYKVHPFWLGRSHVFETKQRAMEYLVNDVTASAIAHGNAIRNMRSFLENLPFHPGSFQNGNQILADHPTQEYTTKRTVNSLKRCGELMCMEDLLEDLKGKQKIIDAKQVCENSQLLTRSIPKDVSTPVEDRPKPMPFKSTARVFSSL